MQADLMESREFARDFLGRLSATAPIQEEFVSAIEECFHRYDTGPYENRFVVGSVVEQLLGAAARALGCECENAGAHRQGYDLELRPGLGLSVKYSSASGRTATVRLTNSQGAVGQWTHGTFFVLPEVGIGYADSDLVPGCTITAGDGKSIDIPIRPLLQLWAVERPEPDRPLPDWLAAIPKPEPRPDFFVPMNLPGRSAVKSPRLAGDPIALDILQSGRTPSLLSNFRWSV
jgi:hypothetical protein